MEISKTNFAELKTLSLSIFTIKAVNNDICSIEQLQFVDIPLLKEINLRKS